MELAHLPIQPIEIKKSNENPAYVDYCRGYPKNEFGNTVDIDCAIENALQKFRLNNAESKNIPNVGPSGEVDVHLWKYIGLKGLIKSFDSWIRGANKEEIIVKQLEKCAIKFYNEE